MVSRLHPLRLAGWLGALLFVSVAPPAASAQAEADAAADEVVELTPLTVAAWRYPEDLARVPAPVRILEEEEIREAGVTDLPALLAAHGVPVQSTSGTPATAEVALRGFGTHAGLRVLVLIDGQRANRPDLGGFNWLEIPLGHIQRVEILRGAQTVRYGDNAIGGVIKITTLQGAGERQGGVRVTGGSNDFWQVQGRFADQFGETTAAAAIEHTNADGWREHSAYRVASGHVTVNGDHEAVSWRLRGSWLDSRYELPGPLSKRRYEEDPRQSFAGRGEADEETAALSAQGTWRLAPERSAEVQLSWRETVRATDLDGSFFDNELRQLVFNPQWSWEDEARSLAVGIDGRHETLTVDRYASADRDRRWGEAHLRQNHAAAYLYGAWQTDGVWTWSGGFRLAHGVLKARSMDFDPFAEGERMTHGFSEQGADSGWAASLGLTRALGESSRLWARTDRLYRYPGTDERAAYQGFPLSEPFARDLSPETGYNVELGGETVRGPWRLSLNLFGQWLDNEIAFDADANLNINLPQTRRWGVEHEVVWTPVRRVALSAQYTWIDATYQEGPYTGNRLFLVPDHRLNLSARWQATDALELRTQVRTVSSRIEGNDFTNTAEELPGHTVTDAVVAYAPVPNWRIHLRVNNLFDEQYADSKFSGGWYPAPGRTVRAALDWTF